MFTATANMQKESRKFFANIAIVKVFLKYVAHSSVQVSPGNTKVSAREIIVPSSAKY